MRLVIPDSELRDPRVRRTRELLQHALRQLLLEKPLDKILVQDITDAATLNRGTLYDHFVDKYALFNAMVANDFYALLVERNIRFDDTCPTGLAAIVLAVCDYLKRPHLDPNGRNKASAFVPLMEAAVTSAIRDVLIGGMPQFEATFALPKNMVATMASWAIYGAVKEGFYAPNHQSADAIVPSIVNVVLPIMMPGASSDGVIRSHEAYIAGKPWPAGRDDAEEHA
jgi:AcrR family transcriptional regulator